MNFSRITLFLSLFFTSFCLGQGPWWQNYNLKRTYVVVEPVADLLTKPARTYSSKNKQAWSVASVYDQLPLSGETQDFPCVRSHQALFNEVLTETHVTGKECKVKLSDAWHAVNEKNKGPITTFYTKTSGICSLATLVRKGMDLNLIPAPSWIIDRELDAVVTLIFPWHNELTGLHFSAGTRFKRLKSEDTPTHHAVHYINYKTLSPEIMYIPRSNCAVEYKRGSAQQRALFLAIIKRWVSDTSCVIPYVLGGASFVHCYSNEKPFTLRTLPNKTQVWQRHETYYPHTGFDCSNLIWRAARIAGIAYFCKNTSTIAQVLMPLSRDQQLQEGDIIVFPGHCMIITNINENELTEAAGYKSGYGQLQALTLSKRIATIATYTDLLDAYYSNKPLALINKDGTLKAPVPFKIFKLIREQ